MTRAAMVLTLLAAAMVSAQEPTTGHAPVNGLKMYYEIHGKGDPVVLLHGSFMTITNNWTGMIGLFIHGDADGVRLDHIAEMFRLKGDEIFGDMRPRSESRLAILPNTTHVSLMERLAVVVPMVNDFLDAPAPARK